RRQGNRETRGAPPSEREVPRRARGEAQGGCGEPEWTAGGAGPPEGEARGPRGLFHAIAGCGVEGRLPVGEDPGDRGTARDELQRGFEEGRVEGQLGRATSIRAGAESAHRGEDRTRNSLPRGFCPNRPTREGGEGLGRLPRKGTGGDRGSDGGRREDAPRHREPGRRPQSASHVTGDRAAPGLASLSRQGHRRSSEADANRASRGRRSEEGHRAAREDHPAGGAGAAGPGGKTAEARG